MGTLWRCMGLTSTHDRAAGPNSPRTTRGNFCCLELACCRTAFIDFDSRFGLHTTWLLVFLEHTCEGPLLHLLVSPLKIGCARAINQVDLVGVSLLVTLLAA